MILEAFFQTIDRPEKPLAILDLCAAPGGKATHLLSLMGSTDTLVANEIHPQRNAILFENLTRWGDPRVMVSRCAPDQLAATHPGRFHVILVDAPCSGEGMFRKDPFAISQWSGDLVDSCVARQHLILDAAYRLLRPGGVLIYSTCTYNREENEEQIARLVIQYGMDLLLPDLDPEWGLVRSDLGYRCYPHRIAGEGLFMSMVRKGATDDGPSVGTSPSLRPNPHIGERQAAPAQVREWLKEANEMEFYLTRQQLWKAIPADMASSAFDLIHSPLDIQAGIQLGRFKTSTLFLPDHALALSTALHPGIPHLELNREEVLSYLKKETIARSSESPGIRLITWRGHGIGWGKLVPGRVNNLLPHHWRIRMNIPE